MIVIFLAIFSLFDPAGNIRGGLPFYNFIFRPRVVLEVWFVNKNVVQLCFSSDKNRTGNETGDREKKTPVCRKRNIPRQRLS